MRNRKNCMWQLALNQGRTNHKADWEKFLGPMKKKGAYEGQKGGRGGL